MVAAAISCLAEIDLQLPVPFGGFSALQPPVDYEQYLTPSWPVVVRCAALESLVRIHFARHGQAVRKIPADSSEKEPPSEINTAVKAASHIARAVHLLLRTVSEDPVREASHTAVI